MEKQQDDLGARLRAVAGDLRREVSRDPYSMLGLAFATGYLLGGGLFHPFSRPLARAAMGRFVWPLFQSHLVKAVADLRETLFTQPAAQA